MQPSFARVRPHRERTARWLIYLVIGTTTAALTGPYLVLALLAMVCAASVVLAIPDVFGSAKGSIGRALSSRYTRTAFASAMILAITMAALVLQLSAPEIVYRQFL